MSLYLYLYLYLYFARSEWLASCNRFAERHQYTVN